MLPAETVQQLLGIALKNGGDLAEIYVENNQTLTLGLDDSRLEQAISGNDRGVGIRVFYGNSAAYAYTDDLSEKALAEAAAIAAAAAKGGSERRTAIDLTRRVSALDYPIEKPFDQLSIAEKGNFLRRIDAAGRRTDSRIVQVQTSYKETDRQVAIYNSDGVWAEDQRQIVEMRIQVTAKDGDVLQPNQTGFGGQKGLELFDQFEVEQVAREAAEGAIKMLDARPLSAGEMPVVISNGWGGVLFHEACGHCLEADFVMQGASPYANLIGERVGSDILNAIDDGTIPGRRGSLRFDDEGTPAARNVLIENGILKGYMWDLAEARRAGVAPSGNGRRESFRHLPLPRMTNTFIDAGPHEPEEIIRSVKKGLYAKNFGGGQVQLGRGDYVFSVTEGYLIENGKLTAPVKGITLLGNGPETLKLIDMIANDVSLDPGMGMCGKGQSARVSVGQPTLRVPKLTVGGTE
ncbi:MAG: TldD/PmbA family protein [Chloroflexota bacterium]